MRHLERLALAALFVSSPAWAQVGEDEPGSAPRAMPGGATTATTAAEPASPAELPGLVGSIDVAPEADPWALYHRATMAIANGDMGAARTHLERLRQTFPDHEAAARAAEVLGAMKRRQDSSLSGGGPEATPFAPPALPPPAPPKPEGDMVPPPAVRAATADPFGPEEVSATARAELVVGQTAWGVAIGAEFCGLVQCDDVRLFVAMPTLGAGIGLAGSLLLTMDGITPGHASLLNTGPLWGTWNALGLLGAIDPVGFSEEALFGVMMGSQVAGIGLGALLWRPLQPTAGDVALANSAGIWAGAVTAMIHGASGFEADQSATLASLVVASDVALVGGAILSRYYPMTRGRVLVIDAGGALGTLLGFGSALLITGSEIDSAAALMVPGMIGTLAGLGITTWATRNWDVPDPPIGVSLLPVEGGAVLTVGGTL